MTDEEDFLKALEATPDAFNLRLVFADWLQDRDRIFECQRSDDPACRCVGGKIKGNLDGLTCTSCLGAVVYPDRKSARSHRWLAVRRWVAHQTATIPTEGVKARPVWAVSCEERLVSVKKLTLMKVPTHYGELFRAASLPLEVFEATRGRHEMCDLPVSPGGSGPVWHYWPSRRQCDAAVIDALNSMPETYWEKK